MIGSFFQQKKKFGFGIKYNKMYHRTFARAQKNVTGQIKSFEKIVRNPSKLFLFTETSFTRYLFSFFRVNIEYVFSAQRFLTKTCFVGFVRAARRTTINRNKRAYSRTTAEKHNRRAVTWCASCAVENFGPTGGISRWYRPLTLIHRSRGS
uniref:Uncharacterized protein n=1 Tax=Sipha flava TaxID=143950 RepID=A0A2S2QRH3_9HEMI